MKPAKPIEKIGIIAYLRRGEVNLMANLNRYPPRRPVVLLCPQPPADPLTPMEKETDSRVVGNDATVQRNFEFLLCLQRAIALGWAHMIHVCEGFRAKQRNWDDAFVGTITKSMSAGQPVAYNCNFHPDLERTVNQQIQQGKRFMFEPASGGNGIGVVSGFAIYDVKWLSQAIGNRGVAELARDNLIPLLFGDPQQVPGLYVNPKTDEASIIAQFDKPDVIMGGPITSDWQPDQKLWE